MADDVEFVMDAVAAMHVAGEAGEIERLAAIIALQHRDRLGRTASLVLEPAEPNAGGEPERDLGLHVDELFLDQLVGGERPTELAPVERVVARRMPAEFGGPEHPPGDAVARVVEAGEWA